MLWHGALQMADREADLATDYDVVVIGAGAGGMTAAAVAATRGLRAIVIEKTGVVGGTTAVSGGMVWAPNSTQAAEPQDTPAQAATYLEAVVGSAAGADLRRHYLAEAPKAIDYLERHTRVRLMPVPFYPDYYPDVPGATLRGRVLEPVPFDARELGDWFPRLRAPLPEFTLFGGMMVARADIVHFRNAFRSPRSTARVLRLLARYAADRTRFHRGTYLVLGNALAARLLKSLLELGVLIRLDTTITRLVQQGGRVTGVEVRDASGTKATIRARRGVILAAGGFSHSSRLRARWLPAEAGEASAAAEGNSGDGLDLGMAAGGVVAETNPNNAFWTPVSKFVRSDGRRGVYPHTVTDRGKPGMLAVNKAGKRFTNEANSYHEFVQAMFRAHNQGPAIPAHLLCDSRALWKYGLGAVRPMTLRLGSYRRSGYLLEAPTIRALADKLGVDADNLEATIATYNRDAATGVDTVFGRGSNAYHRYVGDAANQPNPCLHPVATPPFYAVALYPADLGTSAGLRTSRHGEVLDGNDSPVAGLYACGNDMNSIMCGSYPGPGITLGPALVFGYLAAVHLADSVPA
jgi:succinate dehydrogenase/fumarate reductase flavoprotein subunit